MSSPADVIVRTALAELVTLKDLKERIKTLAYGGYEGTLTGGSPSWSEYDELLAEYMRRKPLAWQAARDALAAHDPVEPAQLPVGWASEPHRFTCSKCGRKTWDDVSGEICNLLQPHGSRCGGVFGNY